MLETVHDLIFKKMNTKFPFYEYKILNNVGQEQLVPQYSLKSGGTFINDLELLDTNTSSKVTSLSLLEVNNFFRMFEQKKFSPSQYRYVKYDTDWQKVYGVTPYYFDKLPKGSTVPIKHQLDGTYCRECRFFLPLQNLTIDHQKPQKGGADAALIKIFRAYGLTQDAPKGHKGQENVRLKASLVGGDTNHVAGANRDATNLKGGMYYSILRHCQLLPQFKGECVHHFLNLAPVCGPCNSSKSNLF